MLSTASANSIGGVWYIARVKVDNRYQRRGFGSELLKRLCALVFADGASELRVAPGGYGSDPERLERFYARAGFVPLADGVMILRRA